MRSRSSVALASPGPRVELLRGLGDRPPDPAGRLVAGDGQRPALPAQPGLAQGVGEQRQRARLALDLAHEQVDEPRLDDQPGLSRRSLTAARRSSARHGAEQVQSLLHEVRERRVTR